MRSVRISEGISNAELEAALPADRVVEINENNRCSLYDTEFVIDESDIAEIVAQ